MQPARLLITGCGRSGTGYVSTLLSRLGLPCSHEVVYGEALCSTGAQPVWSDALRAEASWLAAPYLGSLPAGTIVLHQVREPVSVVRSFLRIRFFEGNGPFKRFAERHVPALAVGSPFERSVKYWLFWNQLVASAAQRSELVYRRHRLEDLDVRFVEKLCLEFGVPRSRAEIQRALAEIPRDVNTSGSKHSDASVRWSNLPRGDWTPDLEEFAGRVGYAGETLDGTLRALSNPRAPLPHGKSDTSTHVGG